MPYAAGGSGDLLARLLGNKLAAIWGQQVVVDNRAGGGGLIGTEFAARSDPDGYTLYLATDGPLTVAASLYKRVPYDWKRDLRAGVDAGDGLSGPDRRARAARTQSSKS